MLPARPPLRVLHSKKGECGTTLMELLMATAAGFIILSAAWQTLSFFQRQFALQQAALSRQQDLRLGLEVLEQEIHQAEADSVSVMGPDEIEFGANVNGLVTTVTAPVASGATSLRVDDGRGWAERKTIVVSWNDHNEVMTLSRDGQRTLLTLTQPIAISIPTGASVSIRNRVRYYSKQDDQGNKRLLRMVDGGASVLFADVQAAKFSYWDEDGRTVNQPGRLKRVVVDVILRGMGTRAVRGISLKS
ncbi:conserved protein of unknown function [Nitrospira japonica]|uniref:Type IV pilus assembly protein PilW n=1 Tax=Nitrospira japonica TaxID=1325564 RepID=A0A1W1I1P0_9BACT|nr:hypothetical protein [Nitrospira japonica]SLM46907.1 conserved protein of unknown function [Nitrospira japonica]